jgi:hypothetical protein
MKPNELMIGDWVWYNNQPYQIRQLGIYGVDRDGEDYPAVCIGKPNGVGLIVGKNEVEPIPLTTEILEKNGFKEYDGLYRLDITEGTFVNVDFKSKEPFVSIHNTCYRATPICRYLHQLQHALRLCGIEKEMTII